MQNISLELPKGKNPPSKFALDRLAGEKGLFAAIISRAIMDLETRTYRRKSAMWFFSKRRSVEGGNYYTFLDCCEILDLAPDQILLQLQRLKLL